MFFFRKWKSPKICSCIAWVTGVVPVAAPSATSAATALRCPACLAVRQATSSTTAQPRSPFVQRLRNLLHLSASRTRLSAVARSVKYRDRKKKLFPQKKKIIKKIVLTPPPTSPRFKWSPNTFDTLTWCLGSASTPLSHGKVEWVLPSRTFFLDTFI